MTSISLVCDSTDGLESDILKEVHREPIQCDDLVMDGAAKQDLSCLNSKQEDMKMDESVTESAVVTVPILQKPSLQITVPPHQDIKLRNNAHKFEKVILDGPVQKCHSCEKLCYGRLVGCYVQLGCGK